ncbi:MAG TPA: class I SAM-dependent RNA methyltransferase, partial [Methyloceanibacter sp.]
MKPEGIEMEVEIGRLGAGGDGVAEGADGPIYVPFTLPRERVKVALKSGQDRAVLLEVIQPSPDRVTPICAYFGVCGGCALQHMEMSAYLGWKREQVAAALQARGIAAEVEAVRPVPLASRRRAALALGRTKEGIALGYRRARSHDLIDVATCPVLAPRISDGLPKLKAALAPLLGGKREARASVTETLTGLDIVLEGVRPSPAALGAFAGKASALGVARLTADGEGIVLGGA